MTRGSGNTRENLLRKERDGHKFARLQDMYRSGDSVVPVALAEWGDGAGGTQQLNVARGEAAVKRAPATAARYYEKTFPFATGVVRELTFEEAKGGMFRAITVENVVYMVEGSGTIEIAGETVAIEAGDAACNPGGVLRGSGDAKVIAWTVEHTFPDAPESSRRDAVPKLVRGSESRVMESAQWDEGGPRIVARTAEEIRSAPSDAIRLRIAAMDFGCNVVARVDGYRGGPTYEAASTFDNYLYILSGAYRYFQDDVAFEARPGDVIREISGHYHHWIRHEDSSFVVATSLPLLRDGEPAADAG